MDWFLFCVIICLKVQKYVGNNSKIYIQRLYSSYKKLFVLSNDYIVLSLKIPQYFGITYKFINTETTFKKYNEI